MGNWDHLKPAYPIAGSQLYNFFALIVDVELSRDRCGSGLVKIVQELKEDSKIYNLLERDLWKVLEV